MPKKKEPTIVEKTNVEIDTTPPPPKTYDWRDPDATFSDDDHSLDAEMWRLANRADSNAS